MDRSAQAAMEFLMTYGWVIMLVLVTIGTLNYFGVFGIQGLIPEKCEFGPGFKCVDYHVGEGEATIIVQNTLGKEIVLTKLSISKKGESNPLCSAPLNEKVASGATATLTCTESFAARGKETYIPSISFTMSGEEFSIGGEIYAAPKKAGPEEALSFEKAPQELPAEICDNAADDDSDDLVDCDDADCSSDPLCTPPPAEVCDNTVDDDGDGLVDCTDMDCSADPACAPK